jgi:hypothetical protein
LQWLLVEAVEQAVLDIHQTATTKEMVVVASQPQMVMVTLEQETMDILLQMQVVEQVLAVVLVVMHQFPMVMVTMDHYSKVVMVSITATPGDQEAAAVADSTAVDLVPMMVTLGVAVEEVQDLLL